ncbi:MAG: SPOR domain-containing protein [candidate division Zixibacteria bacterium]|nr:SPOR domain-containing protein [candidate division Zixibacteria bacterium]
MESTIFRALGAMALTVALLASCSERQKEAARLEEKMRNQLYSDSMSESRANSSPNARTLSSSIDSLSRTDIPVVADTSTISGTPTPGDQLPTSASSDSSLTSMVDESAPAPDAGAIPEEERRPAGGIGGGEALGEFVVQIASTPDREVAEQMLTTYTLKGYPAFLTTAVVREITYYRVRVGRYSSADVAEGVRAELARKFGTSGFVARVK